MNLLESLFGKPVPAVSAIQAQAQLKGARPPFVLDVREPEEYQRGHLAGAKLIPLGNLAARSGELPRDQEILCVCASGNRSGAAARQLLAGGYQVVNLSGGMAGWTAAQLPIKRGSAK